MSCPFLQKLDAIHIVLPHSPTLVFIIYLAIHVGLFRANIPLYGWTIISLASCLLMDI